LALWSRIARAIWEAASTSPPGVRQISEKLGWLQNPSRAEYDLSIYAAGPAGLSAAVYGASKA
jgi:hypothetical protein